MATKNKSVSDPSAFDPDADLGGNVATAPVPASAPSPVKTDGGVPAIVNGGGAIAKAAGPASRLQGADQNDFALPRLHLYQGQPSEAKIFGKGFDPGDLINVLTGEKIAVKSFTPIRGAKSWIKWREPRGSGMDYNHTDKRNVPPADLLWDGENPPAAQEYHNWLLLFEGQEMPATFSFTKTSLGMGKTLNTLESVRAAKGKGPGKYSFDTRDKSNAKGDWKSPTIRPLGDPDEVLAADAQMWYDTTATEDLSAVAAAAGESDETN